MVPVAALAVAVLMPIAVLVGVVFVMGWKFQPIETASMEPRYPSGSLAIVERSTPLVKRLPGESPAWFTRGDANAENDPAPVHAAAVQGRVRWTIPEIDRMMSRLDGWNAIALLVGLPLLVLLVTELDALRRQRSPDMRPTPPEADSGLTP